MSAPAALAVSKLFWPETESIRAKSKDIYNMEKVYVPDDRLLAKYILKEKLTFNIKTI